MLQSMTGFGKASGQFKGKKINCEIKSLNSKGCDLFLRIPSVYKSKELEARKRISDSLVRGKIDCAISIENLSEGSQNTINKELVSNYYAELKALSESLSIPLNDPFSVLLRMPEVFATQQDELDEEEWQLVEKLIDEALKNHIDFRNNEGAILTQELSARIESISQLLKQIPQYEKLRIDSIKSRIESNLEEFLGGTQLDKNRFEQELIYYIEKIDISEEKLRLSQHLDYFIETMNQKESQGRKLGFITQEIGREINTLGSKSYHAEMQKLVVNMKDELEKIKEQILNTL